MQEDFHYHLVYSLCREAGYEAGRAHIVAYASQYVDDNTDRECTVQDNDGPFLASLPSELDIDGTHYFPIISQAVDITSFKRATQRYVYAPFHFVPGDSKVVIKGRTNPLATDRGCRIAEKTLVEAVDSGNLHRIGVALHAYADTWSHEGFSAFHEDWNRLDDKSLFGRLPPCIGHAEAYHQPDKISAVWDDPRLANSKVRNQEKALEACERIFARLASSGATWTSVKATFEDFVRAAGLRERVQKVSSRYNDIKNYQKDAWINEAIVFGRAPRDAFEHELELSTGETPRPRFVDIERVHKDENWFRFQDAAKWYQARVLAETSWI